ncbi:MFS transporter [Priestia megaterium]|uniref:MFS transporter n=1 Tax=Priestia megaterium TaxID=1404 RepID=UPI000BFDF0F1|nr:MFS transporter [Priestia megaterium]PGN53615.1 MFS transporter [Priestia megaterium]PGQ87662.1 MFS transporter [Priestia megaterium]
MKLQTSNGQVHSNEFEKKTVKKIQYRILPFIIILYFIAMLDRTNLSYVASHMTKDLGITSAQYGIVAGIFFIGYFLFEVPSNLLMNKVGARVWIARILITWGIVAAGTSLVQDVMHLYILRFALGIMEAGFFPGIILYLTFWFRKDDRARVISLFMLGLPLAYIFGAPISGLILDHIHWASISSWRWMFFLEGIPAVLLGLCTYFFLVEKPEDAKWLTDKEKDWLQKELESEKQSVSNKYSNSTAKAIFGPMIWLLAIVYFSKTLAIYGVGFFAPQIIDSFTKGLSGTTVGLITAIPYIFASIVMILWGRHSDKTNERRWHIAIPIAICTLALIAFGFTENPIVIIVLLCLINGATFSLYGPFWTLPSLFLTGTSAAAGIAAINAIANLGGFVGPYAIGAINDATGSVYGGLIVIAGVCIIALIIILSLRFDRKEANSDKKIPLENSRKSQSS